MREASRRGILGCTKWMEEEEESGEGLSIWSIDWLFDGRWWWYCLSCSRSYHCIRSRSDQSTISFCRVILLVSNQ
ncbi:hypothetical protein GQ55_3G211000 [Panicum hallii var. hallii]|uniref:Uncharacterized protein n=2 Tax=Panicum hallii TaxID=206008 RepID=A0A2T7EBS1_9POAL|nr:hypothetical protein PAHAL_3G220900 [Panicum hallii]PUZ65280.1 hypothetical protein GQ55_3G211000 [Panicum hallii var. hallii]